MNCMYTLQQKRPTDGERKQYPSAAGKGGRAGKVGGGGVGQGGEGLLVSPMFESREKGHISTVTGLRLNKDSKDAQQMTTGSARARKRESTKGGRGGGQDKKLPGPHLRQIFQRFLRSQTSHRPRSAAHTRPAATSFDALVRPFLRSQGWLPRCNLAHTSAKPK